MTPPFRCAAVLALGLALVLGVRVHGDGMLAEPQGAQALGLLLRRLPNMATVLFATAHPDDEHNGLLVAFARGQGLRTVLLTATRGEGGQNEIGPELGEALGLLRAEELAAIHRRDGVEQRFGRAYDFGYSFSIDETFEKWGRRDVLADFVRVIRAVRPDVVITLPRDARGGLHHQAAAQLAVLAFRAAADAGAFPPAAHGGLEPWQAARLYEGPLGMGGPAGEGLVRVETGEPDVLLGTTPFAYGGRLRELHRTQGMRAPSTANGTAAVFRLIDDEPRGASAAAKTPLDGIDVSWRRLLSFAGERERPALQGAIGAVMEQLERARAAFDAAAPQQTLPPLRTALGLVRRLREEGLVGDWAPAARVEVLSRVDVKERELMEAVGLAHELRFDAVADDGDVVPGQALEVTTSVVNGGREPVRLEDVALEAPDGWTCERKAGAPRLLGAGERAELRYSVRAASKAAITRSAGRKRADADRYEMTDAERTAAVVFPPAPLRARLHFTSGGLLATLERPVVHADGTERRPLSVVPKLAARFLAPTLVVARDAARPRRVEVLVRHFGRTPLAAEVGLEAGDGWTATPAAQPLRFTREGEEQRVVFEVRRPGSSTPAPSLLRAVVRAEGDVYREDLQDIDYPHVTPRRHVRGAELSARVIDVEVAEAGAIGYVEGAGDRVPEALEQLERPVERLRPEDLAAGDLSRYAAIIMGIRAYQTRPDLKQHHARIMEYVRAGGHLVVQYNKFELNDGATDSPFAPYPAAVTGERVTDETAPVRILSPDHPLLTAPNRIGAADFEGWVQERGLHFLDARDPRFEDLLESADPFPANAGPKKGLLVSARVGAGRWTYVGLGLWRQLPAGVPGAYRLLANLISQPRGTETTP